MPNRQPANSTPGSFHVPAQRQRPIHGDVKLYETDPHFCDLVPFYEHDDGNNARGLGTGHQTGWSALVTLL